MKAIVMAGGLGSRLRPLTIGRPKPMVTFINKPVLAHILSLLKRHHFYEVVITVHHMAQQIKDYFGDGRSLGMTLHYAMEETPLGTAGSIKNAESYLDTDDPFLVISGDVITDINLSEIVQFHQHKRAMATMTLKQVSDPSQYGIAVTDSNGQIKRYLEKPDKKQVFSKTANTGIYVLTPEILRYMEANTRYDFSYDIFPLLLKQKSPFFGYVSTGYWSDIGTLQTFAKTKRDVMAGKVKYIQAVQESHYQTWLTLLQTSLKPLPKAKVKI